MKTSVLGLTLLLASTAGAQPDPRDVPTARVSVCTASVATRASVVQVAQQPDRFMGKCVRIDAVMNGLFLYENVDGLYLSDREGLNPSSNGARLGLDDQRPGRLADRGYRRANVVGRVQDCDTVRSAVHASVGQNEIVMVTGYCHYFYGAYLWVEQARDEGPATFVRRLPGAARDGYGNLQSAPADWLYRSMVEAAGHDFLAALRAGDETTLATLHYGSEVEYAKDDLPSLLRFLLRDRTSPFAAIRASKSAPQTVVLIDRDGIPGTLAAVMNRRSVTVASGTAPTAGQSPISMSTTCRRARMRARRLARTWYTGKGRKCGLPRHASVTGYSSPRRRPGSPTKRISTCANAL